jgi:hypothetical protein
MPLYIGRTWGDWALSPNGFDLTGPTWGFDSENNSPVFRSPTGAWVNGRGEPVGPGCTQFNNAKNATVATVVL